MTGRERVLAALEHREPDRVPVDLGSTPSSGISVGAYNAVKRHLGLSDSTTKVYDVVQMLAEPEEPLLDLFGVSVLDVGRTFNEDPSDWYPFTEFEGGAFSFPAYFRPVRESDGSWSAYDSDGVRIASMAAGATFFDQVVYPYADGYPNEFGDLRRAMDRVHWQHFAHSPWHKADRPGFWDDLRVRAQGLRAVTDRALVVVCGCNLFEWGTFLRRADNFLADLLIDRPAVEALLDELVELHLDTLARVCESVGDVVDIVRFGDDLGTNAAPFFSPALYRELFKPRHALLCDYVHRHSSMHTFLHSCGSISVLLPDLIEAGFEIVNPVQTDADGMDPQMLKREFGNDIVFWGGGIDTRSTLTRGTPEAIRDAVRRRIEIMAPGGGFVFNTVHNILPDVPPQNVVAMFEAVQESQ